MEVLKVRSKPMYKKDYSINEYLELICSLLIDQFNIRYEHYNTQELKNEANERYVERDWVYKIGEHFKDLAYYEVPDLKRLQRHHDIGIPSKDFIIEIKYLKNWKTVSKSSNRSNSKLWKEIEKGFQWLAEEIKSEKKGKRAFILIWCNCFDYLGQVVQLGSGRGYKNPVNKDRLVYFPYLMNSKGNTAVAYTRDLIYNYNRIFPCQLDLNYIGMGDIYMNCLFLGSKTDKLHIVIYY